LWRSAVLGRHHGTSGWPCGCKSCLACGQGVLAVSWRWSRRAAVQHVTSAAGNYVPCEPCWSTNAAASVDTCPGSRQHTDARCPAELWWQLTLNFSLLGSFLTRSTSTRQSAPGVSLGMHLPAVMHRGEKKGQQACDEILLVKQGLVRVRMT
jgi:hypothetical protein